MMPLELKIDYVTKIEHGWCRKNRKNLMPRILKEGLYGWNVGATNTERG